MPSLRARIARSPIDPYLLTLLGTVAIALVLPARGRSLAAVDTGVQGAVAGLFFLYGARLSPAAIWAGLMHWRLQGLVFASSFLLFPLVGLAVGALTRPHLPADLVLGLMFLCALPSTVQSSIAFTAIARGNVPAALCAASLSNMAGVVATPVIASLMFASRAGFSASSLGEIAAQILAPFALGQLARPRIGAWLLRHQAITGAFDRGSILLIVYAAFSAGAAAGIWKALSAGDLIAVAVLDLLALGLVIAATTVASRALGFSRADEIAVVFCGSKKSMASGIPMANILFHGHAVALIVLPLMIFHQAQLFVCATLARRYAAQAPDTDTYSAVPLATREAL